MLMDILQCTEKLSFTRRCRPWIPQSPEVQCIRMLEKTWQSSQPGDWETCEEPPSHSLPPGSLFLFKPSSVARQFLNTSSFLLDTGLSVLFLSVQSLRSKNTQFQSSLCFSAMGVRLSGPFCCSIFLSPVGNKGCGELVTPVLCFADCVADKLSECKSCLLHFYQSSQPNLGLAFVVRMCMTSIPPGTSIIQRLRIP